MTLILSRIILTLILFYSIFLVWTKNVDLLLWTKNTITKILPINEESKKGYALDFSFKNTTIVPIRSSNKNIDGKIAVCFYGSAIVNRNTFPSTIKKIEATVKIGKSWLSTILYDIKIGTLENGDNAIVLLSDTSQDMIFLMKWENIHTKINQKKVLTPGEILSGSAVFILDSSIEEAKDIKIIRITISDFLNNKSIQQVNIDTKVFDAISKGFKLIDRGFLQKDNNKLEWIN